MVTAHSQGQVTLTQGKVSCTAKLCVNLNHNSCNVHRVNAGDKYNTRVGVSAKRHPAEQFVNPTSDIAIASNCAEAFSKAMQIHTVDIQNIQKGNTHASKMPPPSPKQS